MLNERLYFAGNTKPKILVTGATGQIGRELVKNLKRTQPDADVVTINPETQKRVDINNKTEIERFLKAQSFDSIYHLAALNPFQSNQGADYFKTNVQGTENLLASVLALKQQHLKTPKVFLASSALVYQPEQLQLDSLPKGGPLSESALEPTLQQSDTVLKHQDPSKAGVSETLLKGLNLSRDAIYYNDSKLLAEMVVRYYAQKGVPLTVGRLVNIYSRDSNQLLNQLVNEANTGSMTLEGKDPNPRDYLFCDGNSAHDDAIRLIRGVAEKGNPGETYHISSNGQFVRAPQALANWIQKKSVANTAEKPEVSVLLNHQKLLNLGLTAPKTTPEKGLALLQGSRFTTAWNRLTQWFHQSWSQFKHWIASWFKHQPKHASEVKPT